MFSLEVRSDVSPQRPELASLERVISEHTTLEAVLRWAHAQEPGAVLEDVVIQDEFTHDVIMRWGALYLVYGTT